MSKNKIIQQIEKAEMVSMANDRTNLLFIEDGVAMDNNDNDTPSKPGETRKQTADKRGTRTTGSTKQDKQGSTKDTGK